MTSYLGNSCHAGLFYRFILYGYRTMGVFYRSAGGVRSGDPRLGDGDARDDPTGPPRDAVQDLRPVQYGGARGLPADRTGQGHHLQVQFIGGSRISRGGFKPGGGVRVQNFTTECRSATAVCWFFCDTVCCGRDTNCKIGFTLNVRATDH